MALGTTALILGAAGVAGGVGLNKFISKAGNQLTAPVPLPQAPSVEAAGEKAENIIKRKRALSTQTVYSSPLGLTGEAQIARKTLTGQ